MIIGHSIILHGTPLPYNIFSSYWEFGIKCYGLWVIDGGDLLGVQSIFKTWLLFDREKVHKYLMEVYEVIF